MDKARNDLSAAVPKFCLALEEHRRTPDGRVRTSQELLATFFPHDEKVCNDRILKYLPNEVRGPILAAWGIRGIKAALRDNDEKVQSVLYDALLAGDVDHTAFEEGLTGETIVRWVPLGDLWAFWRGGKLTKQAIHKALSTAYELFLFDARWFLDTVSARGGALKGTDVLADGLAKEDLTQWVRRIHETGDGSPKGVVSALGWDKIIAKTQNDVLIAALDAVAVKVGLVAPVSKEAPKPADGAPKPEAKAEPAPAAAEPPPVAVAVAVAAAKPLPAAPASAPMVKPSPSTPDATAAIKAEAKRAEIATPTPGAVAAAPEKPAEKPLAEKAAAPEKPAAPEKTAAPADKPAPPAEKPAADKSAAPERPSGTTPVAVPAKAPAVVPPPSSDEPSWSEPPPSAGEELSIAVGSEELITVVVEEDPFAPPKVSAAPAGNAAAPAASKAPAPTLPRTTYDDDEETAIKPLTRSERPPARGPAPTRR